MLALVGGDEFHPGNGPQDAVLADAARGTAYVVATAAAHRQDAFAAAEFLMDYLKTRAPFWKQVEYADGKGGGETTWVDAKPADDALADRWARPGGRRDAAE